MAEIRETVLITDASHPAAQTIADRLHHKHNYNVVMNVPPLETTDNDRGQDGLRYDTCSLAAVQDMLNAVSEGFGRLSHVIQSDWSIVRQDLENITEQALKQCLERNAKSAFLVSKVFGQYLADNGGGSLLYLSTVHAQKPTGAAPGYSMGHGAVQMLCREMALFYGRQGVRANLLQLDALDVQTALLDSTRTPFQYDVGTKVPLGRSSQPLDAAGAAAFMLSQEAGFINGADLIVDGGHLLYFRDR